MDALPARADRGGAGHAPADDDGRCFLFRNLGGRSLCHGACAMRRGTVTWHEWASALARNTARKAGAIPDTGETYSGLLATLETLVAAKGVRHRQFCDPIKIATPGTNAARPALRMGAPIELKPADFG